MTNIAKPIRIEAAFDDPEIIRTLFKRNGPYRSIAEYIPHGSDRPILPHFRGNWAVDGKPLVDGADAILHNRRFLDAARAVRLLAALSHVRRGKSECADAG